MSHIFVKVTDLILIKMCLIMQVLSNTECTLSFEQIEPVKRRSFYTRVATKRVFGSRPGLSGPPHHLPLKLTVYSAEAYVSLRLRGSVCYSCAS